MMRLLFNFAFFFVLALPAYAGRAPYIPVGSAKTKKTVLALTSVQTPVASEVMNNLSRTLELTIQNDLLFMDLFRFLPKSAFLETSQVGVVLGSFKFSEWTSVGAEFLIKSTLSRDDRIIKFEAYLYDVRGAKQILGKRYVADSTEVKTVAHTFANDIVHALTGLPGIFLTKIVMSCDRTENKEIYVTDFDGTNTKQITHHRSISFAPAWSPSGSTIAYSLYALHKGNLMNIDLYEYSFTTNASRMLSNRSGINSGAVYSPDGKNIALTMSFLGNPEIFKLDLSDRTVERLTTSFGFDVDPSWSPDGKALAFVSSRTGQPMVFKMSKEGEGERITRLTFAGRYNATPSWSIQNNKVAFAGWVDNHFDIFIMNPDGTNIERLTKNQGNNEDPHFSPDGNFIVFSSNRTGTKNVYVMNVDGTFVKRLTYGLGNCVAPKWSGPPKKETK